MDCVVGGRVTGGGGGWSVIRSSLCNVLISPPQTMRIDRVRVFSPVRNEDLGTVNELLTVTATRTVQTLMIQQLTSKDYGRMYLSTPFLSLLPYLPFCFMYLSSFFLAPTLVCM